MGRHLLAARPPNLHGIYSRDLEPVLRVRSGDVVSTQTLDAGWNTLAQERPLVFEELAFVEPPDVDQDGHCLTGPIFVEGAEPGMTLEVRIEKVTPGSWGWSRAGGYLTEETAALDVVQDACRLAWELDGEYGVDQYGDRVRLRPFLGVIGMPPAEPGRHSTIPPRRCGGNLDCRELVAGSSLFLPIEVPGALLSVGDGHAAQGDGEVGGMAIECGMAGVEIALVLHPDLELETPRAVTPAGRITMAVDPDLNQAWVTATAAMLDWITELHDIPRERALALASLGVDLRVTQVANGVCGVHALWRADRFDVHD